VVPSLNIVQIMTSTWGHILVKSHLSVHCAIIGALSSGTWRSIWGFIQERSHTSVLPVGRGLLGWISLRCIRHLAVIDWKYTTVKCIPLLLVFSPICLTLSFMVTTKPQVVLLGLKNNIMCLWSARVSVPARAHQHFFSFNLFFSNAPCDPSMPSSEYTWYHGLQNVLASINYHILCIESWIKSGIYSIHIPFFSYLRIKFTTISLLFSPSGISLSKKKTKTKKTKTKKNKPWPHQFWRNSLTRNTFFFFALPVITQLITFTAETIPKSNGVSWF
jgi:hypothetical protein